ncbi:hypothetical protein HYH03_015983 [Edaphochlamys debaryana]|uniref:Uncharacterized protein n=1 Tax=Edaphochlamys debaryana TaxID=47281 RepID=A0A835XKT1_9CHLO|nr:hypothetical protein HYH03_015983 [Edaphochlamys debaryana]|eukprot:KAG2485309.1 hypothetical protein HYH03_015983 [Edaphochlamys debaryana]
MVTLAPCVSLTLPANMSDPKPDLAVPGTCERLADFIASYLVTNAPELVPALALNYTLTDCITKPGPIGENATQYPFNNATSLQVCGLFKPFNPSPLPAWWTNGVFWTASRGLNAALRDAFPEELGLGGFWVSWGYYPPETVGNAVAKPPSPSALPPSPQPPAKLSPPSPPHVGSAPRPPFPPNPAGTITLAPCMRVVFPGNMSATARPDLAVPGTCERYAEVIINHLNDQAAELIPNLAIPFAMTDCKATWGPIGNSTQWPYNNATSVQICGLFKPVPFRPFPTWYTSDVFGQASRTVYTVLRTAFPTELRLGGFWSVWGYSSRIVQGSVP